MIYTLTLNPSLDYLVDTPVLDIGKTNRSKSESLHFGGKGINVSYVLKQLDTESVCLGFTAGFTGKALEDMLKTEGLACDFVQLDKGNTRINVKIKNDSITEINAQGPEISEDDVEKLFEKLGVIKSGDVLVLAGSTPKGLENIYERIMHKLFDKNVRFVVDTTGEKLLNCLKYKPFLVKPNKDELSEIAGKELKTDEEIIAKAKKLKTMGAVNVLVSMGDKGALLVDEEGIVHKARQINITAVSTVGAGDSMVAGFLAGVGKGHEYAIKLGNVCGAATASCQVLADKEMLKSMM